MSSPAESLAAEETITIVLADDHHVVRSGLRLLLEIEEGFEVVAEAADADAALRTVLGHKPTVLVLDLNMPGSVTSLDAIPRVRERSPATSVVVLTHDPKLDDAALIIALRSQAAYIGAMGSRRAQDSRRERLLAKGVEESELERISAPIGLDLGALTAEETALSIMAEIVAMRYGRSGGRLAHAKGRIHEVGV